MQNDKAKVKKQGYTVKPVHLESKNFYIFICHFDF